MKLTLLGSWYRLRVQVKPGLVASQIMRAGIAKGAMAPAAAQPARHSSLLLHPAKPLHVCRGQGLQT
jgi:hypothetical protein